MHPFRKAMTLVLSLAALGAAGWGVAKAVRSPLFTLRVVEVADQPEQSPVDAATITGLAAVPVGQVNLFDVDLKAIERRILSNEWIREVHLTKRFPQTLSIQVVYREPQALLQLDNGALAYVDRDGRSFGQVSLQFQPDLPVLSGFARMAEPERGLRITDALRLLEAWQRSAAGASAQVATVEWDAERGFRALVSYRMGQATGRAMVDLGELDSELDSQLQRLSSVLTYLSSNSISARQIWADAGKKIVVRTTRGT